MGVVPPRRLPIGLIGMLACVLGLEVGVGRREFRLTAVQTLEWKEVGRAVKNARGSAVVALGDSLVKNGVVPSAIEGRLGPDRPVYNLAASGSPMPVNYFLLRRLIEAGTTPEAVFVDGQTLTVSPHEPPMPVPWHMLVSLRELADAAWHCRAPGFFAENAARMGIPSFRHRVMLRTMVMAALTVKLHDDPIHLWTFVASLNRNKGCLLLPDRPKWPRPGGPPSPPEMLAQFSGRWTCHPGQTVYVERFLALAAAHGVRVYWLLMPEEPALNALREQDGWWRAYTEYVRNLQTRHPHLFVIDGHRAAYPPEAMSDILHLSRTGAIAFSDALGTILARADHSRRWIEIPQYDPEHAADLAVRSRTLDVTQHARMLASGNRVAPDVIRR